MNKLTIMSLLLDYVSCMDIGLGSPLSNFVLGLWANPRTRGCPRKRYLCQKRLY